MLLQFLSIFFQYVFLHCGVPASGNDDFLDYTITEFWWNGTPGIEQTDRITPQYSFLTTPVNWLNGVTALTPREIPPEILETFLPFPNTTRPSYPFDIENHTVVKPIHPGYEHRLYSRLTPPPNFPRDYTYPYVEPDLDRTPYSPHPTGPTPKGPSFTIFAKGIPTKFRPGPPLDYQSPPLDYPSPKKDALEPMGRPTTTTTEPPYLKKWQQEISSFVAAESRTPNNVAPELSEVFNYDYNVGGLPEAVRRIRKTPQAAGGILRSSVFEDQTRSILGEDITVTDRREEKIQDEASSYNPSEEWYQVKKRSLRVYAQTLTTGTKQTQDILVEHDNDIKKTISRQNEEKSVSHPYFEKIKTLQEGYMMVFLIELTRLIATKEREAVRDVVKHTDQIIYGFYRRKQLLWFGQPLTDVTRKVARFLKDSTIDVIQNHAANVYHMLSERGQELSVEVNTILEYADMLYEDDEGRLLFDALKEFAAYPNISLTGYWLCNSLIHNFLRPYRRLKNTQQRHELINSVNLELKTRFTWSGFIEELPLRVGDVKDDVSRDEKKLSTPILSVTRTEPHSESTWSPRVRKRKRHHRSHNRKRGRKRHHRTHKRKRVRKRYTQTDLT